jgi:murein DD-endopeptidase MepM/ murein hydrolase activator NlpD
MNKFLILLLLSSLLLSKFSFSQPQVKQPDGGGSYRDLIQIKDEISPEQRSYIISKLQESESRLRSEGRLQSPLNTMATFFAWPLKQALNNNDNGFYGISNYVDENAAYPNQILDYNCGNRTYDQSNGYNHAGTDIFTWPFYWQKMVRNAVEIIAAAPGTIIYKSDGNYDQNCAFCVSACDWNAVYVMHADGSVAWYGHMKLGSLTTKTVGQTVASGEYLGVVGSSGNSTGPHLHFEVYTNSSYTQLIDPWAGTCNNHNGLTSWWANQQPYYVSTLNKIMTHSTAPNMTQCPAGDAPNEKINFADGQAVYVGSYYRDQQNGQQAFHTIYKPDNTVWTNWTQNFTTYYSASWWYYYWFLPNPAPAGNWRYEILYNGKKITTWFAVNSSAVTICPNSFNPVFSNISGSTYQWQVNTGSGFTDITDNSSYSGTTTNQLQLKNVPTSFYGYQYRCFVNGSSYSNTMSLKFVSYWNGFKSTSWDDPFNWSCGNVPDANTDVVIQNDASNFPEVNFNTSCRTVTVGTGATLTVKPGVNLTVTH